MKIPILLGTTTILDRQIMSNPPPQGILFTPMVGQDLHVLLDFGLTNLE